MAKKKDIQKKPPDSNIHRCIECAHAVIHRWGNDPLIAACSGKVKAPRQVARALIKCDVFEKLNGNPNIIDHG